MFPLIGCYNRAAILVQHLTEWGIKQGVDSSSTFYWMRDTTGCWPCFNVLLNEGYKRLAPLHKPIESQVYPAIAGREQIESCLSQVCLCKSQWYRLAQNFEKQIRIYLRTFASRFFYTINLFGNGVWNLQKKKRISFKCHQIFFFNMVIRTK